MSLRINQNVAAYNAHRNLGITDNSLGKSLEKLSSGLRINRAADDAAGLSISEKMRSQVNGMAQAARNAQDGIALIQTAEGALGESHAILQRMRDLSVQASNGTLASADRDAIVVELGALKLEITRIGADTAYNGAKLLTGTLGTTIASIGTNIEAADGYTISHYGAEVSANTYALTYLSGTSSGQMTLTFSGTAGNIVQSITGVGAGSKTLDFTSLKVKVTVGAGFVSGTDVSANNTFLVSGTAVNLHIGPDQNQTIEISIGNMGTAAAGLDIDKVAVNTAANAELAIGYLDSAVAEISSERAKLGSLQNRLEYAISNLGVSRENLAASESRIRDVDMASEMVSFTRNQIMIQAGTAMLAQANSVPQTVLQLLK